jgi:hypothetical protein
MSYTFSLEIGKEHSSLTLLKDDVKVAIREWPEERGSGRAILTAIDEILSELNMTPEMVDTFSIDSNLPETYTSYRIAKTISVVYGFAVGTIRTKTEKKRQAEEL